jgi:hypothetical protein
MKSKSVASSLRLLIIVDHLSRIIGFLIACQKLDKRKENVSVKEKTMEYERKRKTLVHSLVQRNDVNKRRGNEGKRVREKGKGKNIETNVRKKYREEKKRNTDDHVKLIKSKTR